MSKPFKKLVADLPPARKLRIARKTRVLAKELALRELRDALDLTQQELANRLHVKQAAVSKFESQSDLYISTLRKILSAMGANLRIVAEFPSGQVEITQFSEAKPMVTRD